MATSATICLPSALTPGNSIDGVATSNTTNIARTTAPESREITASNPQNGQARYKVALCFRFDPTN